MLNQLVRVTAGVVALSMAAPAFAGLPLNSVESVADSFYHLPKVSAEVEKAVSCIKTSQAVIDHGNEAVAKAGKDQTAAIAAYNATPSRLAVRAAAATAEFVGDAAIATGKFAARKVANTIQEAAELAVAYNVSKAYGSQVVDALLTAGAVAIPGAAGTFMAVGALNKLTDVVPGLSDMKHAGLALVGTHYVIPVAKSVAGFAYDNAPAAWNATKTVASSAWNAVSSGWNALSNYYGG